MGRGAFPPHAVGVGRLGLEGDARSGGVEAKGFAHPFRFVLQERGALVAGVLVPVIETEIPVLLLQPEVVGVGVPRHGHHQCDEEALHRE